MMKTKFYFIQGTPEKIIDRLNFYAQDKENNVEVVRFKEDLEMSYAVFKVTTLEAEEILGEPYQRMTGEEFFNIINKPIVECDGFERHINVWWYGVVAD